MATDELHRIVARFLRQADLNPPLGYPGGPCHVIERIHEDVRNPKVQDHLIEEIEHNDSLSNQDASRIYRLEQERGVGVAKRLSISAHAQYRMDLRGVTVPAVRAALASYSKRYFQLKSQQGPAFQSMDRDLRARQPVRWVDPRLGLTIVFVLEGDQAALVTTFWTGESEPETRPGECSRR